MLVLRRVVVPGQTWQTVLLSLCENYCLTWCVMGVLTLLAVTKAACRLPWPGLLVLEWTWCGPVPWKSSCGFLCCLCALWPWLFLEVLHAMLSCHGPKALLSFLLVRIVTGMVASLSPVRCLAGWQICLCYSSLWGG